MVVVHRFRAYRFMIYLNDHPPAHFHVVGVGAGGEAKIQLVGPDAPLVVKHRGFGPGELRRVVNETTAEKPKLLARWLDLHG
jgi:hypothetical protein